MLREDSLTDDDANIDVNLPPGRMHAVKGQHRLQGSGNIALDGGGSGSAPGTPRSRSRSPCLRAAVAAAAAAGAIDTGKVTLTTADANSSISSLDNDSDIYTDRAGLVDDLSESQRKLHSSLKELHMPPTVNERMTEDTLEDIHAFSDVVRSSNASRVSIVSGSNGDAMLEPLDECEEGLEEDSLDGESTGQADRNGRGAGRDQVTATVILTNMENLTIHQENGANNDDADETDHGVARGGGDASSLQGETPSAPTA